MTLPRWERGACAFVGRLAVRAVPNARAYALSRRAPSSEARTLPRTPSFIGAAASSALCAPHWSRFSFSLLCDAPAIPGPGLAASLALLPLFWQEAGNSGALHFRGLVRVNCSEEGDDAAVLCGLRDLGVAASHRHGGTESLCPARSPLVGPTSAWLTAISACSDTRRLSSRSWRRSSSRRQNGGREQPRRR